MTLAIHDRLHTYALRCIRIDLLFSRSKDSLTARCTSLKHLSNYGCGHHTYVPDHKVRGWRYTLSPLRPAQPKVIASVSHWLADKVVPLVFPARKPRDIHDWRFTASTAYPTRFQRYIGYTGTMRRCTCCLLTILLYDILAVGSLTAAKQQVSRTHNLPLTFEDGRTLVQSGDCTVLLIESMPENLTYWAGAPKHGSTHFAWSLLLNQASHQLSIASFYWSLLADAAFNQSDVSKGRAIFDALMNKSGEINISIAQNGSQVKNEELDALQTKGARVFWIDVSRLLGRGVLHTKLWIVDDSHAYVGSANMDWRSLTEVKELGALILNCPALVEDLKKIHASYLLVSDKLPTEWPTELKTSHNRTNPMQITINGMRSKVYFSASPKEFNADGRTHDLDAILSAITEATKFIYISVMDYSSEIVSYDWHTTGRYWPDIDEALRTAAIDRGVEVRLLISRWPHTSKSSLKYQSSLRALNGVQGSTIRIRYFVVPSFTPAQKMIPHARVNHNKYMVTDQVAYIGTSNWSGDYFLFTGGIGFVIRDETKDNSTYEHLQDPETKSQTIRIQLTEIFLRDWNSEYSFEE